MEPYITVTWSSHPEEHKNEFDDVETLEDQEKYNIYKGEIVEKSPKGRFLWISDELGSGAYKKVYRGYDGETGAEIAWNVISLKSLPICKWR